MLQDDRPAPAPTDQQWNLIWASSSDTQTSRRWRRSLWERKSAQESVDAPARRHQWINAVRLWVCSGWLLCLDAVILHSHFIYLTQAACCLLVPGFSLLKTKEPETFLPLRFRPGLAHPAALLRNNVIDGWILQWRWIKVFLDKQDPDILNHLCITCSIPGVWSQICYFVQPHLRF